MKIRSTVLLLFALNLLAQQKVDPRNTHGMTSEDTRASLYANVPSAGAAAALYGGQLLVSGSP